MRLRLRKRNIGKKQNPSWLFAILGAFAALFFTLVGTLGAGLPGLIIGGGIGLFTIIYFVVHSARTFVQFEPDVIRWRESPFADIELVQISDIVDYKIEKRGPFYLGIRIISSSKLRSPILYPFFYDLRPLMHQLLFRETRGRWPIWNEIEQHVDEYISMADFIVLVQEARMKNAFITGESFQEQL